MHGNRVMAENIHVHSSFTDMNGAESHHVWNAWAAFLRCSKRDCVAYYVVLYFLSLPTLQL